MAFLNVGEGFFLDMTYLDIAALRTGSMTQATAERMTLTYSEAVQDVFVGDFAYRNGILSGGVLTGLGEVIDGQLAFEIYDFSLPVSTFMEFIRSGDTFGALSGMLSGDDELNGNAFNDALGGLGGNDWVRGWGGDDVLFGGEGEDIALGDDGDDDLLGEDGEDILWGGEGSDAIDGGTGNDRLYGQEDHDWLYGGAGDDLLEGGEGADWFAFEEGCGFDSVQDFNAAEGDRVNLHEGEVYQLFQRDGSTVIELAGGEQLTLVGVTQGQLGANWLVQT